MHTKHLPCFLTQGHQTGAPTALIPRLNQSSLWLAKNPQAASHAFLPESEFIRETTKRKRTPAPNALISTPITPEPSLGRFQVPGSGRGRGSGRWGASQGPAIQSCSCAPPTQGLPVKEKGHPHALKLQKTSSKERKTGGTGRFLRSSLGVLSVFYA